MGMSGLPWGRFLVLNFIAAGLWANAFCAAGYLLGQAFENMLGDMARNFGLVMLAVFLTLVALALLLRWRRKVNCAKAAAAAIGTTPRG